ncbi:NAD-dependent epimerase/dehydratase family protein [Deinococcus aestuarii]|uniref:NAD-dependent epimerase/dehydratase family protein n=1 Tax=Deinococcus aestuarii TaxID=2774531 RepID=UPI001C0CD6D1|nr:NAD-dependent epimerase/dehydratase family protein [Deinococcus aestuarii]
MTRYLITGAAGFVGRNLGHALLARMSPEDRLTLLDREVPSPPPGARVIEGDLSEAAGLEAALAARPEVVFHLASVPGALAEREYALGRRVNVDATLDLFQGLADAPRPPTVVYASSVAVYGALGTSPVDGRTPLRPQLSYGTHKRMMELALEDLSRRGELVGVALRLPGLVARPGEGSGFGSAFMGDLIRSLSAGAPSICPVSPDATAWWMSASCAAWNLLHAASLGTSGTFTLPALHLSVAQVVSALCDLFGEDRRALVRYEPLESTEAVFGRFPPLQTPEAQALGFRHDGSAAQLVQAALAAR